jgi:LuxR family transcriptional regulator, maltose regulon positive regulatory protein
MLLGLAHQASGKTATALSAIEDALIRASVERFVRIFLDAGSPLIALLKAAVAHGRAADQASVLLAVGAEMRPAARPALVDDLSRRELEILRLLRSELTGPQIAAELVVSVNTVRTHTKSIFSKLGVTNRRSAVRRADELGL